MESESKEFKIFIKVIYYQDQLPIDFTRADHQAFPTFEMHCYRLKEMILAITFKPAGDFKLIPFYDLIEKKIRAEFEVYSIEYLKPFKDFKKVG